MASTCVSSGCASSHLPPRNSVAGTFMSISLRITFSSNWLGPCVEQASKVSAICFLRPGPVFPTCGATAGRGGAVCIRACGGSYGNGAPRPCSSCSGAGAGAGNSAQPPVSPASSSTARLARQTCRLFMWTGPGPADCRHTSVLDWTDCVEIETFIQISSIANTCLLVTTACPQSRECEQPRPACEHRYCRYGFSVKLRL